MFSNPGTDSHKDSWVADIHRTKLDGAKIEDRNFNKLRALKLYFLQFELVLSCGCGT